MVNRVGCLILILMMCIACTSLSKNRVQRGTIGIRGGVYADKVWRDSLEMDKVSFYQELTLLYDFLITRFDPASPFINWFSPASRDLLKECPEFYLVLSYSQNSSKISNWMFYKEMRMNGFRKVTIDTFKKNMSLHPEWETLNLGHYEVAGLCRMEKRSEEIMISFPGFVKMKL